MPVIIETAIERGLAGIAVTDHLDPLWPDENDPSELDVTAYEAALTEADAFCAGRIHFAKGIELGILAGEANRICADAVSAFPYDFVIASIHYAEAVTIDAPAFLEDRTMKEIIEDYYTLLLEGMKTYKDYDVLGHINCIDRYTDGFAPPELYLPYVDEVLRLAISDGKGIEINTSAFRYGMGHIGTPTQPILNRFKELGGEIVTIGSDAHRTADIGSFIREGEEMLLASGLRHIAVFSGRRPEFIKL